MTRSYLGYVSSQTTDTIVVQGYGTATGGTSSSITADGIAYTLLTFTASGTLTVTKSGLFDVLCIGGGGGGVNNTLFGAGGAGGFQTATFFVDTTLTVTVGAGGATAGSTVGGTSRFGDFLSCGGGGSCDTAADTGLCGASTSGSRAGSPTRNNTVGQGTGGTTSKGGCGAGAISTSGTGGVGKETNTFTGGSSLILANGGNDGGGSGAANTGNGGGNGNVTGGSGIVFVRFKV
jgi:hypothetical protein